MLDTATKLYGAIPAARNASSKEARYSLWVPEPFVKNIFVGNIF